MQVTLTKWGNSLGLRVPKQVADRLALTEGMRMDVSVSDDRIVISAPRERYRLEELLVGMTPQAMHEAFDWGADAGREIVD